MDFERAKKRLEGCYITVPTMFRDSDLAVDLAATRRNVRFLLDNGITERYGTLLAGGAAGDFSTMSFEERVSVAEAVVAESGGRLPVAMGAQTTSTLELRRLAKAAAQAGAEFIQVSCPFYFTHTEEDFFEHVAAAAEAADIGIIIYNTFWTSAPSPSPRSSGWSRSQCRGPEMGDPAPTPWSSRTSSTISRTGSASSTTI
jgi:dihydrodipicolinate synthase/N-acetylneuraminate lyase